MLPCRADRHSSHLEHRPFHPGPWRLASADRALHGRNIAQFNGSRSSRAPTRNIAQFEAVSVPRAQVAGAAMIRPAPRRPPPPGRHRLIRAMFSGAALLTGRLLDKAAGPTGHRGGGRRGVEPAKLAADCRRALDLGDVAIEGAEVRAGPDHAAVDSRAARALRPTGRFVRRLLGAAAPAGGVTVGLYAPRIRRTPYPPRNHTLAPLLP